MKWHVNLCSQRLLMVAFSLLIWNGMGAEALSKAAMSKAQQSISRMLKVKGALSDTDRKVDPAFLPQFSEFEANTLKGSSFLLKGDGSSDGVAECEITCKVSDRLVALIQSLGGGIVHKSEKYGVIHAKMPTAKMRELAKDADVMSIRRIIKPYTNKTNTSQGDTAHRADKARQQLGVTGNGVKVGVISDSARYLSEMQSSGDLPSDVTVLSGYEGVTTDSNGKRTDTGEGSGMMEIVYDLAPSAKLYFASGSGSLSSMASAIDALAAAGCKVIVDDVTYPTEPAFQDGIVAKALTDFTANGGVYFSSSANSGNLDSSTSGTWEGDYVQSSRVTIDGEEYYFAAFDSDDNNMNGLTAGNSVVLQWSDPWGNSSNDYDLFILNSSGKVLAYSMYSQKGSGYVPFEYIDTSSVRGESGYYVSIAKSSSAERRYLRIDTHRGRLALGTAGSTYGHNAAERAITVAAASAPNRVFTSSDPIETFSSDGPRKMFFDYSGNLLSTGYMSSGGKTVKKPDITAADETLSKWTQLSDDWDTFSGTSAAAPHAAAIAALMLEANPSLKRDDIMDIFSTTTFSTPVWNRTKGYGIIDAYAAVQEAKNRVVAELSSIAVSGSSSVTSGDTATYTCTATYSDGSTKTVSPTWSISSGSGSISSSGVFSAPTVTSSQNVTIKASYTDNGVTKVATISVTVSPADTMLSSISISGSSSVSSGGMATYTCTATYSDGSTATVTPTWTVPSGSGTISSTGVFTAPTVTSDQSVTIRASYTEGSVTETSTLSVTVTASSALPDLSFATLSNWDYGSAMFTTTGFNDAPVGVFDKGSGFTAVFGFGNFGEVATSCGFNSLVEILDEDGSVMDVYTNEYSYTIRPGYGSRVGVSKPNWANFAAGPYMVRVTLDSDQAIAESDETDNVRTCAFAIRDSVTLKVALDSDLSFSTTGDGSWYGTKGYGADGIDCAASPMTGNGTTNDLVATVSGSGMISFKWKVSSEQNHDFLQFWVDDVLQDEISGKGAGWQTVDVTISGSGSHKLVWRYAKDSSLFGGMDCGWVDQVSWTGSGEDPTPGTGTCYALLVGINQYSLSGCSTLSGSVPDAKSMKMICTDYGDWPEGNIVTLTDSAATLAQFRQEIANLVAKANSGDTVLIFDSGHGGAYTDSSGNYTKDTYICAYDDIYLDTVFAADIAQFKSGVKVVVLLDTCHSAGMFKSATLMNKAVTKSYVNNFIANVGAAIDGAMAKSAEEGKSTISSSDIGWIAAAEYNTYSYDLGGMGLFTGWMLVDSGIMNAEADTDGDGQITLRELYENAVEISEDARLSQVAQAANLSVLSSISFTDRHLALDDAMDAELGLKSDGAPLCWVGQSVGKNAADGVNVARSPVLPDQEFAEMGAYVTGPGTLSFKWKVSSEANYDKLYFIVDDAITNDCISGEREWSDKSVSLDSGEHHVTWRYVKDVSNTSGSDCGFVDQVRWGGPSTVTVTFDPNGGTVGETTRQLTSGSAIGTLPEPTWDADHTFVGWYTANNLEVTASTVVNGDMTVYAHWTTPSEGSYYALLVGINRYSLSSCSTLSGSVPDAKSMKMVCTEYGDWAAEDIVMLTDESATLERFRQEIANLASKAVAGDTVLIFDSGHGGAYTDSSGAYTKDAYICAYDAIYSDTMFASDIAQFKSGVKVVVVLDTCCAAGMYKDASVSKAVSMTYINNFMANVSIAVDGIARKSAAGKAEKTTISSSEIGWLVAADYDTYSYDLGGMGLFTGWMFVDSGILNAEADANGDGRITMRELYDNAVGISESMELSQVAKAENLSVLSSVSFTDKYLTLDDAVDSDLGMITGSSPICWVGQAVGENAADGMHAARSPVLPDDSWSAMGMYVTGPGVLSFKWKVSSEANCDKLYFIIDSTVTNDFISGECGWTAKSVRIGSGSHFVSWSYAKDVSSESGSDCGWVDQVAWEGQELITITFDANGEGATISETSRRLEPGMPIGELPTATWDDGHTFAGWYTASDVKVEEATTFNSDVTLYAHWTTPSNANVPAWSEVSTSYEMVQTIYARAYDGEAQKYLDHEDGWLGAFDADGVIRGKVQIMDGPSGKMFSLDVGFNGYVIEDLTIKYWDPVVGELTASEKISLTSGYDIGDILEPVDIVFGGVIPTMDISIQNGFTWMSMPVIPEDLSPSAVFADCDFVNKDKISTMGSSAAYANGQWYGTLSELVPGKTYVVKKSTEGTQTVKVLGTSLDGTAEVESGWNWIGTSSLSGVAVSDVKHSGGFANKDKITAQAGHGSAAYANGQWYGTLTALLPGFGYKVKVANAGTLTFSSGKGVKVAIDADLSSDGEGSTGPSWGAIGNYENSQTIYASVYDRTAAANVTREDAWLGAFDTNGVVRGKVKIMNGPNGKMFSLDVGFDGSGIKNLTLKYWDPENGEKTVEGTADVSNGADIGDIMEPVTYYMTMQGGTPDPSDSDEPKTWGTSGNYENTQTIYACIYDRTAAANVTRDDAWLGAFDTNGVIRGKVKIMNGPIGKMFSLDVGFDGSNVENLTLKYWDPDNGEKIVDETPSVYNGTDIGDIMEPVTYNINPNDPPPPPSVITNTVTFAVTTNGVHVGGGELVQKVIEGNDAVEPIVVGTNDYVFVGWDVPFTNVHSDLTVTAQFRYEEPVPPPPPSVITNTVTFVIDTHRGLRTGGGALVQNVVEGHDAVAPTVVARIGYVFTGWDVAFTNVQSDITVTAQFEDALSELEFAVEPGEIMDAISLSTKVEGFVSKWSAKNLPKGLKLDSGSGVIWGTPTVPGLYTVVITAKGGSPETFTIVIKVANFTDDEVPLDDSYGTYLVGAKTVLDFTEFADCKVSGLPSGLKFATKYAYDKNLGEIEAGMIYGVPTKACTNTVTFVRTVGGVKHTATTVFKVASLPAWAIGTFNGRLEDGTGSATITVGNGGKISGKVTLDGKSCSFSAVGFESVDGGGDYVERLIAETTVKSGQTTYPLSIEVTEDGASGVISDSQYDNDRTFVTWRNIWKDKGVTSLLSNFVGTYTVQLACEDTGYGYLSMTIDAKGNCKTTGKLPDGTSASGTLPLIWDTRLEEPFAVWHLAPGSYKGGVVSGYLFVDTNKTVFAEDVLWTSYAPTASEEYGEGFERTMTAKGAWYNKLSSLSAYYENALTFSADAPEFDYTLKMTDYDDNGKKTTISELTTTDAVDVEHWDDLTISLDGNGTAFVVDAGKATKPVQDKETKEWSYEGANDAALTVSFAKATGIFKGSFTCWYDYVSSVDYTKDDGEKTTHTSKKVSFEGVMIQGEPLKGFYLWNRQSSYEDTKTGKEKTFKYKESHPVIFE